jgi:hypothetical protein
MESCHMDADPSVTPTDRMALRSSSFIHSINVNLRTVGVTPAHSDQIAFFCECSNPSCYAAVWMSPAAFDAAAAAGPTWLLIKGHEPSGLEHIVQDASLGKTIVRRPIAARPRRSVRHRVTLSSAIGVVERLGKAS